MTANRTLLFAFTAAVAATVGWNASGARAATNLLANPGFENGAGGGSLTGWGAFSNTFAAGTDGGVPTHTGNGVAKMFGSFNGNFGVSGAFQEFPTTPGTTYQFHVFSRQNAGDDLTKGNNWAVEKIAFFSSPGVEITSAAVEQRILDALSDVDTWIDNPTITATAPAGATLVQPLILFLQPVPNGGGAGFFDDATFSVVPEPASLGLIAGALALVGSRRRRGVQ
jgi:hypothetical protein